MKKFFLCLAGLCCFAFAQAQVKKKITVTKKAVLIRKKPQPVSTTQTKKAPIMTKEFKKADWISNTDVYEVNIRQYTKEGTFNAFAKEMPRLKDMGVSTLWFMPITPIAQKNKKGSLGSPYACSDYTSINPEFGTIDDFRNLVNEAHALGFKVIIDWVANHTGWDHVWTKSHPEYYEIDPATKDFKIASGMDDIIELDFKNPALRKAMIDAMDFWVKECDIDGFRCDLAFWVELDFWLEARTALEKTKTLFWLAECDAIDHASYFQAFDACYTWTWMHKTQDFYKNNEQAGVLRQLLRKYNDAADGKAIRLWFTTNHDENTWNGTEYEKYGDAAKALAVLSFTWNGIPLIYSGQEMPNQKRLKFFDKDPIEWTGTYGEEFFYRMLLTLRKRNPALNAGDSNVKTYLLETSKEDKVLAYLRENGKNQVLVLLNLSAEDVSFTTVSTEFSGNYYDIFDKSKSLQFPVKKEAGSDESEMTTKKIKLEKRTEEIKLQPWGYLVLEKSNNE